MTFQELINSVLRRLREDTVSSAWTGAINDSSDVDDYQALVGEIVNEAKELVENAWDWTTLRSIVPISTVSGTSDYTITGANDRTRVLEVFDDTNNQILPQMSDSSFYNYKYIGNQTNATPVAFRLNGTTLSVYPVPDAAYDLKIHVVIPQNDLTLAADTLTVPPQAVKLGAYSLALAERGEDGGTSVDVAGQRFANTLADSIAQDSGRTLDETLWYAN